MCTARAYWKTSESWVSVRSKQFSRPKSFLIEADFNKDFAERVAKELLTDPVCEEYYIGRSGPPAGLAKATLIEVHLKSGVTDPVAESVMAAIADMGVKANNVRTARKYVLLGDITTKTDGHNCKENPGK